MNARATSLRRSRRHYRQLRPCRHPHPTPVYADETPAPTTAIDGVKVMPRIGEDSTEHHAPPTTTDVAIDDQRPPSTAGDAVITNT